MLDIAFDLIKKNCKYHPQKPKFNGSFNYQSGSERTYFFRTGLRFLKGQDKITKDDKTFAIPIGLALTVKWLWIDGSWKIIVEQTVKEPTQRRKNWVRWE